MPDNPRLQRLLNPRSLAVIGGRPAEIAVEQCRALGYAGEIWPVHPTRAELGGVPCFSALSQLPGVPDAAFALDHAHRLIEVEVNPLLVLARGAMAVDALIRLAEPEA